MGNVEDNFVTLEQDMDNNPVTFNMIEDESGDIFWGYGHQDAESFIAEVGRYLTHCGLSAEELPSHIEGVDHLWAKYREDGEVFELVEPTGTEADAFIFPVTRLML